MIFTLCLVCPILPSGPARAGRLDAHDRQLLEAQVEALIQRLGGDRLAAPLELVRQLVPSVSGISIQASISREKAFAGIDLLQLTASVAGPPEFLLRYLGQVHQAGFAVTLPFKTRREGILDRMSLSLWCPRGTRFDPRAGDEDLTKLRDNLIWLESQRRIFPRLLAVVQALSDAEAVRVDQADWEGHILRLKGHASDQNSDRVFQQELRRRAAKFPGKPKVRFKDWEYGAPQKNPGDGLNLRDVDLADAALLLCEVSGRDLVLAAGPSRVSASYRDKNADGLFASLLSGIPLRKFPPDDMLVAGPRLAANPPRADMFPSIALSLRLGRTPPGALFSLLADQSRIGLIPPPPSDLNVTLAVRDRSVRQVAQATLWALGLRPEGNRKLVAPLPISVRIPRSATADDAPVDLYAADAPAGLLIRALSGPPDPRPACPTEAGGVTLRLRKVPRARLLKLLQVSYPISKTPDREDLACEKASAGRQSEASDPRLAAVFRQGRQSRALLEMDGRYRWLTEGAKLADGSRLRRIFSSRVLLRSPSNQKKSVQLSRKAGSPAPQGHPGRSDVMRIPISRLQLAGTAVLGEKGAGLLADPQGNLHLVKQGSPLGRRCGRVTGVRPGTVTVELDCPHPFDAKKFDLYLNPRIDSGSRGR